MIRRDAFDRLAVFMQNNPLPVALLLIDIRNSSEINEKYGTGAADEALKKIAALLREEFRSKDYTARIAEDQFAVIMTNVTSRHTMVIECKIDDMNCKLNEQTDGIPAAVCAGVAFSENGYTQELYENAAHMLALVKEQDRNECMFFRKEDMDSGKNQ